MEPKDRLKTAREKAGYASPTEAARANRGINVNTIISNENGNRPISKKMAQVYADAFGVSAGWILYGDDQVKLFQREPKSQPEKKDVFKLIPEFDVHVSAGGGSLVADESEISRWPFNPDYISKFLGLAKAKLAIVEVRGDSMEPTLMSGDRVLVNMSDQQISQSGIFVLYDGDGTVVKRVDKKIGEDETVTLISDNPIHERYEVPIYLLNVVGRVVWVARRL
jgi:phage repressor protein C with HTH and peptisase S24 domain